MKKYYIIVYSATEPASNFCKFVNVLTEEDPVEWYIEFKSNILLENPVRYDLINFIELSEDQYYSLKEIQNR